MNVIHINDGVRLHFLKSRIFNTETVAVLLRQPLRRETVSENILISAMFKRGTKKLDSSRKISEYAQKLWGTEIECYAMKKGREQIITLYAETINEGDNFIKVCELIFEMLFEPYTENGGFCKKFFDDEKKSAVNALKDRMNDKKTFAKEKCTEIMYGDVCADGYEEDFINADRIKVFDRYKKILQDAVIEILVIGDTDKDTENAIRKMCAKRFNFERSVIELADKINYAKNENRETVINMNVEQSRLCIGYKTGVKPESNEIYALAAANEILGGSGNSKLFANVREKKGLCYYVGSRVLRFEGDFIVESGIKKSDLDEAVKSIDEETEKIKNGDFSEEEFKNALSTLKKKYILINDSESSQLDFYANSIIIGAETDRNRIIDVIDGITKKQVCESMGNAEKYAEVFLCRGEKNEK